MARVYASNTVTREIIKMHKTIKDQHQEIRLMNKKEKEIIQEKEINPEIQNGKWRRRDFGVKADHFELAQYNIKKLDIL
jgi:hypothetical protein